MTLTCSQFEGVVAALTRDALTNANPRPSLAVLRSLDRTATARIVMRVIAEHAARADLVALSVRATPAPERMPL